MSKKSRRRNKRLALLAGLAGAVALSSKKKRDASIADNEANESGFAASNKKPSIADVSGPTKDTSKSNVVADVVTKPKTVVNRSRNKVIYSDGTSDTPGTIYQKNKIKNEMPDTPPPSIDNPYSSRVIKGRIGMGRNLKSGGRAKLKSGGKVRGCGIAKRGLGRAMKKGKR